MNPDAGGAHQLENRVQRNGFSDDRHTAQTESCGQRATRGNALAKMHVLGPQPDRVAERRGVLHGPLKHQRVDHRHLGLTESDAT